MDPIIGEIRIFPYAHLYPEGWLPCDGSTYKIANYPALYAVIGVTYGGDGKSVFKVPNLQGRAIVGAGKGPDTSQYNIGVPVGSDVVPIALESQLPLHTHPVIFEHIPYKQEPAAYGPSPVKDQSYPSRYWFNLTSVKSVPTYLAYSEVKGVDPPPVDLVKFSNAMVAPLAGGSTPHENQQPYLALRPCISYDGIFPPRPDPS